MHENICLNLKYVYNFLLFFIVSTKTKRKHIFNILLKCSLQKNVPRLGQQSEKIIHSINRGK